MEGGWSRLYLALRCSLCPSLLHVFLNFFGQVAAQEATLHADGRHTGEGSEHTRYLLVARLGADILILLSTSHWPK